MDEQQKQNLRVALIAFNITVMVLMIAFAITGSFQAVSTRAIVSVIVGAVVGGLAFGVAHMTQK